MNVQLLHSSFVWKIDERAREPLALLVNKSPAAFIFIRKIDDLQRENRSTISNEKVEGL